MIWKNKINSNLNKEKKSTGKKEQSHKNNLLEESINNNNQLSQSIEYLSGSASIHSNNSFSD